MSGTTGEREGEKAHARRFHVEKPTRNDQEGSKARDQREDVVLTRRWCNEDAKESEGKTEDVFGRFCIFSSEHRTQKNAEQQIEEK